MQQVMCLSAVCHRTTAPLPLTQHSQEHPQRSGSMLTVLGSSKNTAVQEQRWSQGVREKSQLCIKRNQIFHQAKLNRKCLYICPLEGTSEQETCSASSQQAPAQTSEGKLNTCWVIFAEGSFCKLNFINQDIFNKCWALKAQKKVAKQDDIRAWCTF